MDTRVYLQDHATPGVGDTCVAAIVAKNPGSATHSTLGVLALLTIGKDKMLPTVRNRFRSAYHVAGKKIPDGAFVQVWNLFYLCNPSLSAALSAFSKVPSPPICSSESTPPKIVWFAWGGPHGALNVLKSRFTTAPFSTPFFYDHKTRCVVRRVPTISDFAKHPQGMPGAPIVSFLRGIV